jgi:2-keto-4-pentenoate hydratase/2-oxohepta-3-ene-1,7-dioic acid hydratase in catechol pathway
MSAFAGQNKWTVRWLALQCAHFLSIELLAERSPRVRSLVSRGGFMRWVSLSRQSRRDAEIGILHDGRIYVRRGHESLVDVLAPGHDTAAATAAAVLADPADVLPEANVRLLAPIRVPPSIRDFMAFEGHAVTSLKAIGQTLHPHWYDIPTFYFTNPAAVRDHRAEIPVSPGSGAFDYELEVAIVIGKPGGDIPITRAFEHIGGFMLFCDWSARDLQVHEMAIGLGPAKGKDSATSFGPWLVTPEEFEPHRSGRGYDRQMQVWVNGALYSAGNLSDLSWSFEEMIAYASRGTQLVPGDVLGSGTVGTGCILELSRVHGEDKYPYLVSGDDVCLTVEGLGSIEVTIAPAPPVHPLRAG